MTKKQLIFNILMPSLVFIVFCVAAFQMLSK